jgi:hypothetical protein
LGAVRRYPIERRLSAHLGGAQLAEDARRLGPGLYAGDRSQSGFAGTVPPFVLKGAGPSIALDRNRVQRR